MLGAKTLFATHYHELTVLAPGPARVHNYNIAVKKRQEDIIFLRKIVPGGADQSFGVEVAKLAGLPARVITRAHTILKELESGCTRWLRQFLLPTRRSRSFRCSRSTIQRFGSGWSRSL